ncbi:MAG: InlB B-repeat-containing protein [bacterium JZ-2024 1]
MRLFRMCGFSRCWGDFLRQVAFILLPGLLLYLTACGGGGAPSFLLKIVIPQGQQGTVTSADGRINCGTDCEERYPSGTQVTLNAQPAQGWIFSGWTGDCTGNSPQIQVTMNTNKTCTANFAPEPDFSLSCNPSSLSATQGGTATSTCTVQSTGGFNSAVNLSCENAPSGVTCTFAPNPVTPPANGSVNSTLTVNVPGSVQAGNYSFRARGDGGNKTHTFDLSLSVQQPTLTVQKQGSGSGTVQTQEQPPKIDCGNTCSASYDYGTIVTLTATPDPTSRFDGWGGDADCSDGQVTMDANKTCTATFTLESLQLSGRAVYDDNSPVAGANVTIRTEDGSARKTTITDNQGNYSAGIPDAGNQRVLVRVDVSGPPGISGFKWSNIPLSVGAYQFDDIVLPNPQGAQLTNLGGGNFENSDRSIQLSGAPNNVANVWARSFDPDQQPNAFPGEFSEGQNIPLNSTVFVWIAGTDAQGNPMGNFDPPAQLIVKIPQSQWQDLEDLEPNQNNGIQIPIYSFNYTTGYWEGQTNNGILTDINGNIIPENENDNIRNGTYAGDVYAQFQIDHLSWWNVDYPGPCGKDFGDAPDPTYPSLLSSNGARHDSTCRAWLGRWVDNENDADLPDKDWFDDSIIQIAPLTVRVSNYNWPGTLYLNVLSDQNNDGDWSDPGEWVVQNQPVNLPLRRSAPVETTFTWDEKRWIRITLTGAPITDNPWTGTGSFEIGETEDYNIRKHVLSLNVSGRGTVTDDGGQINCREGSTTGCYAEYQRGSTVILTATTDPDETFLGWGGDCASAGNNPTCTLTMDGDKNVFASFTRPPALRVEVLANGKVTSTPPGIDCRGRGGGPPENPNGNDCYEEFPRNSDVTLTATPDPDETFLGWGGDCAPAGNNPTCTLNMGTTDKFVTADFTVKLTVYITGQGKVNINPPNVDCTPDSPPPCVQHYPPGTEVTLTATAFPDWEFAGWEGFPCDQNPCTLNPYNTAVAAVFRPLALTITTTDLVAGTAGQPYTAFVDAQGGIKPYTWAKVGGTADWATVTTENNRGKITGTPQAPGDYTIDVRVTDSNTPQGSDQKTFTIHINPPGQNLTIHFLNQCDQPQNNVWVYLTEPRTEEKMSGADGPGTVVFTNVSTPYTVTWGFDDGNANTTDSLETARVIDPTLPIEITLHIENPSVTCPNEGTSSATISGSVTGGNLGDAGPVNSNFFTGGDQFLFPIKTSFTINLSTLPDDGTPVPFALEAWTIGNTATCDPTQNNLVECYCSKYGIRRDPNNPDFVKKGDALTGKNINLSLNCSPQQTGNYNWPSEFTAYNERTVLVALSLTPEEGMGLLHYLQSQPYTSTPQTLPGTYNFILPAGLGPFTKSEDRYFYYFDYMQTVNDRGTPDDSNDDIFRVARFIRNLPIGASPGPVDYLSLTSGTAPPDMATNVPLTVPFQWTYSNPNDSRIKFVNLEIECVNRVTNHCEADEVVWGIHLQLQNPFQSAFTLPDLSGTTQKPSSLGLRNSTSYRWRVTAQNFDILQVLTGGNPWEQNLFAESGTDGYRFDTAP